MTTAVTELPVTETTAAAPVVLTFDELLTRVHAIGRDVLAVHANDVDRLARFPSESIEAMKQAQLLSAYVPQEYGGMGLNIVEISRICEAFGNYCGSSAMIYAMHCIQVACVVHHAQHSSYFRRYLKHLVPVANYDGFAAFDQAAGGEVASVAELADAALGFAGQHRTDLHALLAGCLNSGGKLFGDLLVGLNDDVAFVVDLVFQRHATHNAIAQRLDDFTRLDDRLDFDAFARAAVHFGHDHVLREEERKRNAFASCCFYILENPVRAKLVEKSAEWQFSGAVLPGYPDVHPLHDGFWEWFWKLYAKTRDAEPPPSEPVPLLPSDALEK